MADYEIPEITGEDGITDVPKLVNDTMKGDGPWISAPKFQEPMHFATEIEQDENDKWSLIPNWKEAALEKMDDLRGRYRSLQLFLDICVKCGACTDKCHYYLGTSDPKNMPVARQDLLRKVYRRYFTFAGEIFS